jgi:hypothetical protein
VSDLPVPTLTFVVVLLCTGGIFGVIRVGIIVENSRVVGNTAATFAGGMYADSDCTLRITSTTVAGNRAGIGGT